MTGWNSITTNMLARDLEGITELAYGDDVPKENAYGRGKFPIGRTEGNYAANASLSLYKEESDGLQLSLPPGGRIQDIPPFDITVEYETTTGVIMRDRIRNCEFTGKSIEVAQGDGTIVTQYVLIASHIDWNV